MTVFEARASAVLYNLFAGRGDDGVILLPASVCPIVPIVLRKAGRRFEFVDIDPRTLAIDRALTLSRLQRSAGDVAGVMFVRPYGAAGKQESFFAELKASWPHLVVVDDRCLCAPEPDEAALGAPAADGFPTAADVVLYSTGPQKPVDLGFGGFAHLRPALGYRRLHLPFTRQALHEVERGYKLAFAGRQWFDSGDESWLELGPPAMSWGEYRSLLLERRTAASARRLGLNEIYARELPASVQLGEGFHGWRFQIRVPQPDRLIQRLEQAGLFAGRHYPPPTGVFTDERFPVAEALYASIVNLFNDAPYDADQAQRTAGVVREHLASAIG